MRTLSYVAGGAAALTLALGLATGCGRDQPKPALLAPAGRVSGQFPSEPMQAPGGGVVRFRARAGTAGAGPAVMLRADDGREVWPWGGPVSVGPDWKTVNFPAPAGPFRIVARGLGPNGRMEFTAPQEISRFSYFAGKLVRSPIWPVAAALVVWCGFGVIHGCWGRRPVRKASGRTWPPAIAVVPWVALLAYGIFWAFHLDPVAGPNDSGGYLNNAKLLYERRIAASPRTIAGPAGKGIEITAYLPITFQATPDGKMAPQYPVGFPLEVAAVAGLVGLERAVPSVIAGQLVLGVILVWLLARAFGLGRGWAWLAAGFVALSPVYLYQALQPQSDGPALVWDTAAVYFAWTSRDRPWRGLLAGLATALAIQIRPSNILCLIPLAVCVAGRWRACALWVLGALPGAAWLLWYQHALYGSALATGYGDQSAKFALHYLGPTLCSYARWLPYFFTPVIGLGLAGPFLRRVPVRARIVLASWAVAFLAFYSVYWCTYDRWYNMRFVLPAAPAMILLGLMVLQRVSDRVRWAPVPKAAVVCGLFAILGYGIVDESVTFLLDVNRTPAQAAQWAKGHLPADAIVFGKHETGSLFYYTDLTFVRTDYQDAQSPKFVAQIAASGRPIYALTYHWERQGFQWGHGLGDGYPNVPGPWRELASFNDGEVHAWALAPGPQMAPK